MTQFEIVNRTPYATAPLFLAEEEGRELFVAVVKATLILPPTSRWVAAQEQEPVNLTPVHYGSPGESSLKYESDVAFSKIGTDIILIGDAFASRPGAIESEITLRVGPLQKTVRVFGDRYWLNSFGAKMASRPRPFEFIPLIWENAFGGWDRTGKDQKDHEFDPRNPVGTGFRSRKGVFEEGVRLPNLEDSSNPIRTYFDAPPPSGFGFISGEWQDRAKYSGTYDKAWAAGRSPLLPRDFNRRFFNAATPGLVAEQGLRGGEPVFVSNVSKQGDLRFELPRLPPPVCRVGVRSGSEEQVATVLDTVIINARECRLVLVWRGSTILKEPIHALTRVTFDAQA